MPRHGFCPRNSSSRLPSCGLCWNRGRYTQQGRRNSQRWPCQCQLENEWTWIDMVIHMVIGGLWLFIPLYKFTICQFSNWIACFVCLISVFFVNDHVNVSWSFRLDLDLQTSNQSLKNKQNNMVTACNSTSTNFKSTILSSKHGSNIVPKSWNVQFLLTFSQLAISVKTLVPFPKSHCCFMDLYLFPQS